MHDKAISALSGLISSRVPSTSLASDPSISRCSDVGMSNHRQCPRRRPFVHRLSPVLTDCPGVLAHRGVYGVAGPLGFISPGREGCAVKSRVPGAAGWSVCKLELGG